MKRRLLAGLLVAGAVGVAAGCGGGSKTPAPPYQHFESRPDLKPPVVTVTKREPGLAPGYIFLGPKQTVRQQGPLIVDDRGQVVWFHPGPKTLGIADVRVQRYHGQPVLTWWHGKSYLGYGRGSWVIMDESYHRLAEVYAGNGVLGDQHDFTITKRNTALVTVYHRVAHVDLRPVGGKRDGVVLDSGVQEIDIDTGKVLFDWRALAHVGIRESYSPVSSAAQTGGAWDYFHANSVDLDADGNLIVSARNTHTIYKVDRKTGRVLWRLGGKRDDFTRGPGVRFEWQHDARRQADGTLTLFDNAAAPPREKFSRALVLRVDEQAKRATLVRSYQQRQLLSPHQGNTQVLPDGHVFVDWGGLPYFAEYTEDGKLLFSAHMNAGSDTYRAFRQPWVGRPATDPAIAVRPRGDHVTVYASWNGATEVARWQVRAGATRLHQEPVATAPRTGFETAIDVETELPFLSVVALDRDGRILGTSRVRFAPAAA